jgi:chloramphenicol 3-O phosphotransferase
MSTRARIILLNGAGSAGKSSIAKALQAIAKEPFLHVQMDAFLDMLPEGYTNRPDGFIFNSVDGNGEPQIIIIPGPVGERAMRGMRHAIAALAREGNNLIVDDVILGNQMAEYAALLADFELLAVGVYAPLDVLEARERARGDRMIGLARWQFDRVHAGIVYDLEVDTSGATPMECAMRIKEKFRL